MKKITKLSLFLIIVAGIFFLGGINVRFLVGNELLTYDEFNFKIGIPPDSENTIFAVLSYSSILIMISYVILFIFSIIFAATYKIDYKKNVWIVMCYIMFFVFSPVEFYSFFIDLKFSLLYLYNQSNLWESGIRDELLTLFGERIGLLKGVPWIAVLCYYTIIFISVFQPLKKTKEELEKQTKKQSENDYKYHLHEDDDLDIIKNEKSNKETT